MSIQGASAYTIRNYDITNGATQEVDATYDSAVPIGVHHTMDDAGRTFHDTPFDDWVDGGAGADTIMLRGGEDIAHAGGGADLIKAVGVGRSLLDGGDGDDVIHLVSSAPYSTVLGGAGNDRIYVSAPAAMLYGGAGDDFYTLKGATAGGTVITDSEGANRLEIDNGRVPVGFKHGFGHGSDHGRVPVSFERMPGNDNLYILVGGDETYDRARDVVWVHFFANPENQVNGHTSAEIAEMAAIFGVPPAAPDSEVPEGQPTTAQVTSADCHVIA